MPTPIFTEVQPTLENYWRAIILFGRNVASYKFALAKSLLEVGQGGQTVIPLSELALPFAKHLAAHLKNADKQATSRSSQFLDFCRRFNKREVTEEQLSEATTRLGFNNVIDAFHVVGNGEIGVHFFTDERAGQQKAIRLTDEFFRLTEQFQHRNLPYEVEARWRLVETAWQLNLPRNTLVVSYDSGAELLIAEDRLLRRTSITPCRDALNGYQKGKCFYCFRDISLVDGAGDLADVDHFFPHRLKGFRVADPVDGVWNLVLACQACNRGGEGKFDRLPQVRYLERLHRRNEYLIDSHHPLRETLRLQTGASEAARCAFLQEAYGGAIRLLVQTWKPHDELEPAF
jgi:5-methylcytosine-specific restriction endonuclease McrA